MKFDFWNKKKTEQKKVYVPKDKRRMVLKAYDDYMAAKPGSDYLARYDFWALAEEVCPEVREGKWQAQMKNGTMPYFVKAED